MLTDEVYDRRWPPYHDRLIDQLGTLEEHGWEEGELQDAFLRILRTGDAGTQQALEQKVEVLMRSHGFGNALDAWGMEIERVKGFRLE